MREERGCIDGSSLAGSSNSWAMGANKGPSGAKVLLHTKVCVGPGTVAELAVSSLVFRLVAKEGKIRGGKP